MPLYNGSGLTVINSSASGTQTAWNPGIKGHTLVLWDGAGGTLTVQGLASAPAGTIFTLRNVKASFGQASFTHLSGSAAVADRLNNKFTGISTNVFNRGFITYINDGTNWQLVDHSPGVSVTPSFSAGDYTAQPSGTWTVESGDVTTRIYYSKRKVHCLLQISGTTVAQNGGDPTTLRIAGIAWSGGLSVSSNPYTFPVFILDNNVGTRGYGTIASSTSVLNIQKEDGTQFAAATDTTGIFANFSVEAT